MWRGEEESLEEWMVEGRSGCKVERKRGERNLRMINKRKKNVE